MNHDLYNTLAELYPELVRVIEQDSNILCPAYEDIFKAFELTASKPIKVVILGQEPYNTPNRANGLAFGYHEDYTGPLDSSLLNISKEIASDTLCTVTDLSLKSLAEQGVLLLNTILTTVHGRSLAHAGLGWNEFVATVISELNSLKYSIVFMLWGDNAATYEQYITGAHHLVLKTSHPAALSAGRGFIGCGHFSEANKFLDTRGKDVVDWGKLLH